MGLKIKHSYSTYFDVSELSDQDVFRLEVAVAEAQLMNIMQPRQYFAQHEPS